MSAAQGVYKAPLYAFLLNNVNGSSVSTSINSFLANPYSVTVNGTTDSWSVLQTSIAPVTITQTSGTATGLITLNSSVGFGNTLIELLWKRFNPSASAGSVTSSVPVSVILALSDGTPILYYILGLTISSGYPVLDQKGPTAYSNTTSSSSAFKNTSASPYTGWNYDYNTRLAFQQASSSVNGIGFEAKISSTVSGGQALLENRIVQRQGSSLESSAGFVGIALFSN